PRAPATARRPVRTLAYCRWDARSIRTACPRPLPSPAMTSTTPSSPSDRTRSTADPHAPSTSNPAPSLALLLHTAPSIQPSPTIRHPAASATSPASLASPLSRAPPNDDPDARDPSPPLDPPARCCPPRSAASTAPTPLCRTLSWSNPTLYPLPLSPASPASRSGSSPLRGARPSLPSDDPSIPTCRSRTPGAATSDPPPLRTGWSSLPPSAARSDPLPPPLPRALDPAAPAPSSPHPPVRCPAASAADAPRDTLDPAPHTLLHASRARAHPPLAPRLARRTTPHDYPATLPASS